MYKIKDSMWEKNRKEKRSQNRFHLFVMFIVCAMLYLIFLNAFILSTVMVVGRSMDTTLNNGDMLIMDKYASVERGSIIIIDNVVENSASSTGYDWIIKRVIGVGGDTVEIKEDGKVYLNGSALSEPYLDKWQDTKIYSKTEGFHYGYNKWVLKDNEIFYLGDNRINSRDARKEGPCKTKDVVGVIPKWSLSIKGLTTGYFNFVESILGQSSCSRTGN